MNRVALVTGAARGIGAATVDALAADDWRILAVDCVADEPSLSYPLASVDDLADVVARNGGSERVRPYVADVRDPGALAAAVATVADAWGGLDAAIACAGAIAGGVPMWEMAVDQERAMLDINLGGVLNLARAAIPALLARAEPRQGRFLAVSSAAAHKGLEQIAAYSAAKAGVNGAIRALAAELADTGVTVNAVSPGSTRTAILEASAGLYHLERSDVFADQQPMKRLLAPAEIASVLAFLASEGSSAMTGVVVPVDGGMTL